MSKVDTFILLGLAAVSAGICAWLCFIFFEPIAVVIMSDIAFFLVCLMIGER